MIIIKKSLLYNMNGSCLRILAFAYSGVLQYSYIYYALLYIGYSGKDFMAADSLILIIDDDEAVRISLSMHLEDMGYECLLAADGVEGLTLFSENNPDCVLVDLRMPGMNGMDVIKKITGITKEIPVIVVSSQDHLGNAIDAVRAGAWDYILKPIESMEIVTHCVNKALEKKELLENRREYQENLEKRVETRTTLLKNANEELKQKTRDLENMLEIKSSNSGNRRIIRNAASNGCLQNIYT